MYGTAVKKNLSFGVILLLKRGCRQFHLLMLASHTLTAKELSKMTAKLFIGLNKQRNKAWLMDISHVEYIGLLVIQSTADRGFGYACMARQFPDCDFSHTIGVSQAQAGSLQTELCSR